MRYKLLKDLPDVKAGVIFEHRSGWCVSLNTKEREINYPITIVNSNPDWFEKIEEPKFKVGDWVYYDKKSARQDGSNMRSGYYRIIGLRMAWELIAELDATTHCRECYANDLRLATPEEIKAHLIEEAKRRGLVMGVKYFSADGNNFEARQIKGDFYYCNNDMLTDGWGGCVYCQGKWAEIIKQEEKIMVGSYEVKFGADYIVVGCKRYSELDVLNLLSAMEYLKITSIEIAGVKVPLETVKKIAERLK